jgi:phage terminase large subunit-like protein
MDKTKGETFYAAQLQNTPAERADNPIKQHHITRAWCEPEDVPESAKASLHLSTDIAFKDGKGYIEQRGDWGVGQLWGLDAGKAWLLHGAHGRWTQEEHGRMLVRMQEYAMMELHSVIRSISYDKPLGGLGDILTKWHYEVFTDKGLPVPRLIPFARSGQKKIDRILGVTGYWQDGRVRVQRGVEGSQELMQQMMMIGLSQFDDHADAASDVWDAEIMAALSPGAANAIAGNSRQIDWTPPFAVDSDDDEDWDDFEQGSNW